MRFAVESWAPDFGAAGDGSGLSDSDAEVDVTVEMAAADWSPLTPTATPAGSLLFIDGVQRIDARIWVTASPPSAADGPARSDVEAELARLGVCASWAAGAVLCDGRADVVAVDVRRGVLCPGDDVEPIVTRHGTYQPRPPARSSAGDPLNEALGQARGDLEARVAIEAASATPADLVIVDGPLGDRRHIPGAVGYVKAHHVSYLPRSLQAVQVALGAGQRTPLFSIGGRRYRYSWYLRLPTEATSHPGAGMVRCEAAGELSIPDAAALADRVTVTLPRFASRPHQDPRAPQNLHPIAGLERRLRHCLGEATLLERALRHAAISN
jgi:hypothetical protein